MKTQKFQVGQWVFSEFKLKVVEEIRDSHVTKLSDGHFSSCYSNLDDICFPLDMPGKLISETYEASYNRLHSDCGSLNLNFPDICRWYLEEWCGAMKQRHNDEAVKKAYERLRQFEREIIDSVRDITQKAVDGIILFR